MKRFITISLLLLTIPAFCQKPNLTNDTQGTLPINRGGTGATTAAEARTALGITTPDVSGKADTTYVDAQVATKEASLGNPSQNGYVLSSTTSGTRSWIAPSGGMLYPGAGIAVSSGAAWNTSLTLDTDVTLAANSDTRLATQKAVKAYADSKINWANLAPITFWTPVTGTSSAASVATINKVMLTHFYVVTPVKFNYINLTNQAADAGGFYSFGIYSMDGQTLYAHTTAQGFVGTVTYRTLAVAEGTVTLAPGDYLFAWTGTATTATFTTFAQFQTLLQAAQGSSTTNGVMPSTTTVPALSPNMAAVNIVAFQLRYQ